MDVNQTEKMNSNESLSDLKNAIIEQTLNDLKDKWEKDKVDQFKSLVQTAVKYKKGLILREFKNSIQEMEDSQDKKDMKESLEALL